MNEGQRRHYHARLWPAACRALGLDRRDGEARRAFTLETTRLIGAPETDSSAALDEAGVTALFCRLEHVSRPADLRASAAWAECREDYRTFNALRQADWWRRQAGYRAGGRLDRRRFGGRRGSGFCGQAEMSREEAEQYLMTMRARAGRRKEVQSSRFAASRVQGSRFKVQGSDLRSEIGDLRGAGRKAEGGDRKAEGGRRKAEAGDRKAEGGRRKPEGGRRKAALPGRRRYRIER